MYSDIYKMVNGLCPNYLANQVEIVLSKNTVQMKQRENIYILINVRLAKNRKCYFMMDIKFTIIYQRIYKMNKVYIVLKER